MHEYEINGIKNLITAELKSKNEADDLYFPVHRGIALRSA